MRLQSPARNYIKSLLVHPDGFTDENIWEQLCDLDLMGVSPQYVARLRAKLPPVPKPFYPDDPSHAPSFKYVTKERIHTIFQRTISMKTALSLLQLPRVKEFIEALSLVTVPDAAISAHVTKAYRSFCTPDALTLYRHYFWNMEICSVTCMRLLLQLEFDQAGLTNPELASAGRALTRAYYRDPRRLAAELPRSHTTALLVQERLGTAPKDLDLAQILLEARNMMSLRMSEAAHQDGNGDSVKCLNYSNSIRIAEEQLQTMQNPQDQMRGQLQAIGLRTEAKPLPSIHALSAGKHTVDVAPLRDPKHDESGDPDATPGRKDS